MKNHITDNESLHSFFSYVSKIVLIIPIFIVVISLFFKFNQPKTDTIAQNHNVETPKLGVSTNTNSFKFDLVGPIVCDNLFIQNKKVLLKNKTTNYLLNGDCLYIWETGKSIGEKKCGLSSYIGMAENYLGFLSIDDLINNSFVKDKIKNRDIDLGKIVNSCKRGEIRDRNIFQIPSKILFKNS